MYYYKKIYPKRYRLVSNNQKYDESKESDSKKYRILL